MLNLRFKVSKVTIAPNSVIVVLKPEDRNLPTINLFGKHLSFQEEYKKDQIVNVVITKEQ